VYNTLGLYQGDNRENGNIIDDDKDNDDEVLMVMIVGIY
jgi:hypothetical protein